MKLLDTLFNNKRIDFVNTYLFNYTFPDVSFNNKEPIEILIVDTDIIHKPKKQKKNFSLLNIIKSSLLLNLIKYSFQSLHILNKIIKITTH